MNSSAAGTPPPSLSQPVVSPSAMPYGISQSTGGPASSAFASAAVPNGIFGFPQQLHGVHPHGYYAIGTPSMAGAGMYPSHLYQHQPHPGLMGSPGLFQPAVAAPQPPYVAGGAYPYYGWPAAAPPPGLFYHPSAGVPPTASPAAAAMAPVPTTAAAFGAGPTPPPHVIQTASSVEAPQRGGANGHTNGSSTGSSESKTGTPVSGNGQRPSTQQTRSSHGSGGTAAAEQHSSGNGNASPNGHHRHGSSANGAVAPSRANGQPSSATRHHAANGNGHGAAFDGNFDVSCSNRAIVENRQLVVKFLTDETNEKQFRELFERFGPVDNARIIYDRKTNHTKGFGFITYKHTEHAVQALRNMGGYQLHGRQLNVALAQTERKRAFSTEELLAPPPAATPAATAAGDAPNTTGATSGATEAMAGASAPGTAAALAASARPAGATTATLTTTATHRNRGVQAGPVRSPVGSSNNVTSGSSGADDDTAPTNGNSSNNSGGGVHHEAHAGGKSSADAAMPTPANGPTGTDTASTTDSSNRGGSGHDGRNNARSDNDSGSSGHHERLSSSPPTVDAAAAATSSQQGRDGDRGSPATPTTSDPAGTSSPKSSSTPPNASTPTSDRNSL